MENLDPDLGEIPADTRQTLAKKIAISGLLVSVLLSVIGTIAAVPTQSSSADEYSSSSDYSDSTNIDWAPAGFTVWRDDSNVAYRWVDKSNCESYGCVSAEFVSQYGCPNSFYAAINWLDASDSVISYDNATLPSLNPMQSAKLRFDDIEGNGVSGQMAEISCR
jgi:hypothetical protein